MNLQQFNYILAVADVKHFELAAEKCFISQSTLSTMISKFEDEIGIQIFDRKKKPVQLTNEGKKIIAQIELIMNEVEQLKECVKEVKGEVSGKINIGVIPTIAPFLLPLFMQNFASKIPKVHLSVSEATTNEIVQKLKSRNLDIGILSLPINDPDLVEIHLYDERFVYFDAGKVHESPILLQNIAINNLCLLEEGHCMRTQVENLCDLNKIAPKTTFNFEYSAGSIDSLLRFVKSNKAATLLPFLSTLDFSSDEMQHLTEFYPPIPHRSVGLLVHRHFVKKSVLVLLEQEIKSVVSAFFPDKQLFGKLLPPLKK